MGMFLEFFKFEMRFRLKSVSTYIYFLLWVDVFVLERGFGELRADGQRQRQGAAQRSLWHHIQ